jgi:hypothetical protein
MHGLQPGHLIGRRKEVALSWQSFEYAVGRPFDTSGNVFSLLIHVLRGPTPCTRVGTVPNFGWYRTVVKKD